MRCRIGLHPWHYVYRSPFAVHPIAKVCRRCGLRRRIGDDRGRGELALVVLVLLVVVAVAGGVGGFLSSALGPVEGPLCAVPTAAGCPDGPRP